MSKKIYLIFFCLVFPFTACLDSLDTHWSEGNYEVWDSPTAPSCKNLYYNLGGGSGIGRVNCISRIGSNDRYIVAASGASYWILDKEKDDKYFNSDEIIFGPFDIDEFDSVKEKLGISSLEFEEDF
jgi:hypothetical protein